MGKRKVQQSTDPRVVRRGAIDDAHVVAFHPGGAGFRPLPHQTPAERLAVAERQLLDASIEYFLEREGDLPELAVSIVALRAQVGQ